MHQDMLTHFAEVFLAQVRFMWYPTWEDAPAATANSQLLHSPPVLSPSEQPPVLLSSLSSPSNNSSLSWQQRDTSAACCLGSISLTPPIWLLKNKAGGEPLGSKGKEFHFSCLSDQGSCFNYSISFSPARVSKIRTPLKAHPWSKWLLLWQAGSILLPLPR